jgi:hypothetical protein
MSKLNVSGFSLRLLFLRFCPLLAIASLSMAPGIDSIPAADASIMSVWHSIFRSPPPPPQTGLSRGDSLCSVPPIAHSEDSTEPPNSSGDHPSTVELSEIWNDRPTLTWFGSSMAVREMKVFLKGEEMPVWVWSNPELQQSSDRAASEPQSPHHVRVETPLVPGQIYEWHIIRPLNPEPDIIQFQTLTNEEIESIAEAVPVAGIADEASALERADYFAGQQLWSDFWQEIFSVQSPSAQLNQLITETFEAQCNQVNDSPQR